MDGLKTSEYLLETTRAHIKGEIDIAGAQRRIQCYYKEQKPRQAVEDGTMEADIVSTRIAKLRGKRTFQFSPAELQSIYKRIYHLQMRQHTLKEKPWNRKISRLLLYSVNSI